MTEIKNPYQSLIDQEKLKNEPDFFNLESRKQGATSTAGKPLNSNEKIADKDLIIQAIQTVQDPEIPINIYDLGLIYNIEIMDNGDVNITMTLTAPNCPVAGEIPQWVADAVAKVAGTGIISVQLSWTPKWTKDMMSEDAKFALAEIF